MMELIRKLSFQKVDGKTTAQECIIHHLFISDILSPEGIAVDWISRRIYWTDSTKDTIEVASLDDAKLRAVLVRKDLVNPRGIAVDPHHG